jgi:hypothetical protein
LLHKYLTQNNEVSPKDRCCGKKSYGGLLSEIPINQNPKNFLSMTDTIVKNYSLETGEIISYDKGAKLVKNYADQNDDNIISNFVGREVIEAILAQPGVAGISMYQGVSEVGAPTQVLVGVDAEGECVLNFTTVGDSGEMIKQKGIVATGVRNDGPGTPQEDSWF